MSPTGIYSTLALILFWTGCSHSEDPNRFNPVRTYLDESVRNGTVAGGSVLVYQKEKIVFQTGFGYADIKTKKPFEVDTPVVIASISKPVLGTALYRLVDAGKLDLTVPISKYLPEFAGCKLESGVAVKRAPTVTELLTHTSGLRHDSAPKGRIWYQDWSKEQTMDVVVNKIAKDFPFKAQPGTKYAYSGIGTEVAARVGEVISGLPRNEMLVNLLCEPLGMNHTIYRDARGLEQLKKAMPTRYFRSKETGKLLVSKTRLIPPTNRYSSSGGTVISTAPDLLRWLLMIRNGGVHDSGVFLSPDTLATMLKQDRLGTNALGGLFVRSKDEEGNPVVYGHTGSSGTNVWIDFKNDAIGIMLTQTKGSDIKPFRIELERRITKSVSR